MKHLLTLFVLALFAAAGCSKSPSPKHDPAADYWIDAFSRQPGRFVSAPSGDKAYTLTDTTSGEFWILHFEFLSNGWIRVAGPVTPSPRATVEKP